VRHLAERFGILLVSSLPESLVRQCGFEPLARPEAAVAQAIEALGPDSRAGAVAAICDRHAKESPRRQAP
jgi:hypothetical protein